MELLDGHVLIQVTYDFAAELHGDGGYGPGLADGIRRNGIGRDGNEKTPQMSCIPTQNVNRRAGEEFMRQSLDPGAPKEHESHMRKDDRR
jgi:hypothetical protein